MQDNANDMKFRERSLFGEKHPQTSLTDEQVKCILYELYVGETISNLSKIAILNNA
jgi:hypothetical protein